MAGVQVAKSFNGKSDSETAADKIYRGVIAPNWEGTVVKRFDTNKSEEWKGPLDGINLAAELSKGYIWQHRVLD